MPLLTKLKTLVGLELSKQEKQYLEDERHLQDKKIQEQEKLRRENQKNNTIFWTKRFQNDLNNKMECLYKTGTPQTQRYTDLGNYESILEAIVLPKYNQLFQKKGLHLVWHKTECTTRAPFEGTFFHNDYTFYVYEEKRKDSLFDNDSGLSV
jgi:hypothetical protein